MFMDDLINGSLSSPSHSADASRSHWKSYNCSRIYNPTMLQRNTAVDSHARHNFLQGIRGLASLGVYVSHFSGPFYRGIAYAYGSQGNSSAWQLPIIRLLFAGSSMVPLFFVVSGYALSIHYATLSGQGRTSEALRSTSSKAFRRGIRLFGPSLVVSLMMAVLVIVGVYGCDCHWLDDGSRVVPARLDTLLLQFTDWFNWVWTALLYPSAWLGNLPFATSNEYSFQLWTIPVEYYASMGLFAAQVALVECTPVARLAILAVVGLFALACLQWHLFCFFAGAIMAEADEVAHKYESLEKSATTRFRGCTILTLQASKMVGYLLLLVTGLVLASFPDALASSTPGFSILATLTPSERVWQSLGATACVFAISRLPIICHLLEGRIMMFVGRISYGLYLIHVLVLGLGGWRLVPTLRAVISESTWYREEAGFAMAFIVITPIIMMVSYFWTIHVDEPLVRLSKRIVGQSDSRSRMCISSTATTLV